MADSNDRNIKPSEARQTFPLPALTDFSRFDKIANPQGKNDLPGWKLPPLNIPSILDKPGIGLDKPGTGLDKIIQIPPLPVKPNDSSATNKPSDAQNKLKAGPDGKIEISEKDFDKIGPVAAKVLKDAGVSKITITPGKGFDTYEADLKKPLEIPQDPSVDGTRKLKIASHFKADVSKQADGSLKIDNIEGLTAETKVLFSWKEAQVNKIQILPTQDGKTEVRTTGSWNGISRDNTRIKEGEIFEKAKLLFDRMDNLKKNAEKPAFLDIPKIPGQ